MIDGQGAGWWPDYAGHAGNDLPHRPFMVRMRGCSRVLVSGLTLVDSPMFHLALGADDLTVFGVTIRAPSGSPNTDGIDPAGRRILIQDCSISDGDDDIALKPTGAPCGDVLVSDCEVLSGHGVSVGGQLGHGVSGMVVRNVAFDGTVTGLRLKADPNRGGSLDQVSYSGLSMTRVAYPIVFYSYYGEVGNPGAIGGRRETSPAKVREWNARPPHAYAPGGPVTRWHGIVVRDLLASGATGRSIIWGGPVAGSLFDGVLLDNVRISGGAGLAVYDATDVRLARGTRVGPLLVCNALVVRSQPSGRSVAPGSTFRLEVGVEGGAGEGGPAPAVHWELGGRPLADGPRPDGSIVGGAGTAALVVASAGAAEAGEYRAIATTGLDRYDPGLRALVRGGMPVEARSEAALVAVGGAPSSGPGR